MEANKQFRDWWVNCMDRSPIPKGYVIPIQRALQGHPESPRLWHQHIHNILIKDEGFECCTHEPCLYFKRDPKDITHENEITPIDTTQLVLDSVSPPYTATAAKFERPSETEIPKRDDDHAVYIKNTDDGFVLILRQVDKFAISGSSPEACNSVRQTIQNQMTNKLHDLGVII
jgi:hypothetical protein